jgi:hypothetical protein
VRTGISAGKVSPPFLKILYNPEKFENNFMISITLDFLSLEEEEILSLLEWVKVSEKE